MMQDFPLHVSGAALAAQQATTTIPIVMAGADNPVELGLVASLARPGGNITGLSNVATEVSGKQLELLKEVVPELSRLAVLWNSTTAAEVHTFSRLQAAAKALGLTVLAADVHEPGQLDAAFAVITQEGANALYVPPNTLNTTYAQRIIEFATAKRLPTMYGDKRAVAAGGLMSYWPDRAEYRRRAAVYVDKILKGAKPADLPVEQPMRFEMVINLKTAKALGITIPPSLLVLADEVIQ
jgi:putative ABC transport system substrate-binding protein